MLQCSAPFNRFMCALQNGRAGQNLLKLQCFNPNLEKMPQASPRFSGCVFRTAAYIQSCCGVFPDAAALLGRFLPITLPRPSGRGFLFAPRLRVIEP
jgi:hypothetical protein